MKDHLYSEVIREERIYIKDIPAILLRPKIVKEKFPTLIFYHGWGSSKESQRAKMLLLASVGLQILIPDAIYHGERNAIEHNLYNGKFFWDTIFRNMEESGLLIEEVINKYEGDRNNIFLMGHSMGGITVAGIFTYNTKIKSVIVLNGSFAWKEINEMLVEVLIDEIGNKLVEADFKKLEEARAKISEVDPMENTHLLKDRYILMLHGGMDSVIPIKSQKIFLSKMESLYGQKDSIRIIEYPNLEHLVSIDMIEDGIMWIKQF